jgi:2-dehydropantoate 2-reductase
MRLLVLGAGGIGGYFGGRLAESGADVTFLVRPRRREQLERDGLIVESQLGDMRLRVKTVVAEELKPAYDLVLLTCKAYDLESAMDSIAPGIQGSCCILPVLNGMAHFARLDERFGARVVLGGTCSVNVTLLDDGTIRHAGTMHRLVFGERGQPASARTNAFAGIIAKSKIDWEQSPNVEQDLWEKIVFLSVLAATTCLFRANMGEILRAPGGREAAERALRTNIEIATREGFPPRSAAVDFARKLLGDPASSLTASMLRDLERGSPVESDHIVGWMLDKARHHSLDDTILSLAFTHLKAYEARRAAGRIAS